MIREYNHIILSLIFIALLIACDDSLGTDPDYKKTITEKDTVLLHRIDTLVQIDTVLSSDSMQYKFTIDSLITVRDSLGNIIDSLTQHIIDIETIDVAPKFNLIVDQIKTLVTYKTLDTLFDANQQQYYDSVEKVALYQPFQDSIENYSVVLDTNLNRKKAWIYFYFDGKHNNRDTTDKQDVYINSSAIYLDNVLIYNSYLLDDGITSGDKKYHDTRVISSAEIDITDQTLKLGTISFEDYRFDGNDKLTGFTVKLVILLDADNTQLRNKESKYEITVKLSYP